MSKSLNSHTLKIFTLKIIIFLAHDEPPSWITPSLNLQNHVPVMPFFAFPPPETHHANTSSSKDSDTNSNTTVYHTISQFNNSDMETPDKFAYSEPSPSTFSQPTFQSLHSQIKLEPPSTPSSIYDVTPTYFSLTSDPSNTNIPVNMQLANELDNFYYTSATNTAPSNTNYFHQLSSIHNIIESYSTTQTHHRFPPSFPSHPQSAQSFINHPVNTNTKNFFPQYIYFHSDSNDEYPNYVNEHVLYPTLSWTSFYNFTKPLSLPLYNTPYDNEQCSTQLYHLTTALTPKQFTQIGYQQSLIRFNAPKANQYSIDHYDHHILRAIEDIFLDIDRNANTKLTENTIIINTQYVFTINSLDKTRPHHFSSTQ